MKLKSKVFSLLLLLCANVQADDIDDPRITFYIGLAGSTPGVFAAVYDFDRSYIRKCHRELTIEEIKYFTNLEGSVLQQMANLYINHFDLQNLEEIKKTIMCI